MLTEDNLRELYWNKKLSLRQIAKIENTNLKAIQRKMDGFGIKRRIFSTKGLQPRLGAILSKETKDKIAKSHKGKKHTEETKKKISIANIGKRSGENSPSWKGGIITQEGYTKVKMRNHPRANIQGYIGAHILILEEKIGRYLKENEVAHHINELKWDNRLENLQLMNFNEHSQYHAIKRYKRLNQ